MTVNLVNSIGDTFLSGVASSYAVKFMIVGDTLVHWILPHFLFLL